MPQLRVALVCDALEEQWPSMDLVADMLFQCLREGHSDIQVEQLRPPIKRHLTRLGGFAPSSKARNAERLFHRFFAYPALLRKRLADFDIFHVIDHSYSQLVHGLPPERTIVSCHDLDTFRCVLEPEKETRSRSFRLMTKRILDGLVKASFVICDSHTVREELVGHGVIPEARVKVVVHAAHPECSPDPDPAADAAVEKMLQLNENSRYLLHVGSTIARKRIGTLLEVFGAVRNSHPDIKLVRVGGAFTPSQESLAQQLGIREAIQVLPHIDRRTLAAVYRRADLLLMTSDAEGFGLPVVEAMACGCPVIASDLKVLHEIGGEAAVYCPPGDIQTWTRTVNALVTQKTDNPSEWRQRQRLGKINAARFTWSQSANQCAAIYRSLCNSHLHARNAT